VGDWLAGHDGRLADRADLRGLRFVHGHRWMLSAWQNRQPRTGARQMA
jgi:hypothetical protein